MIVKTAPIKTTEADLHRIVRVGRLIGLQDFIQWGVFACMIIVFLTSYMTSVRETGRDPGIAPLFGGLGLITLIIVGSLGVKYLNSRFEMSKLRKTGALDISATYQFDEDFVTVEDSKGNQSKVRWSEYQKVTKSGDYYFLKFNKKSFQWIPVRAFLSAEDREAFEKIVSARGLLGKK